jgi:alcohol dehydrogenase class IV
MELRGNWNYPTSIRFGAGRIAELPDACRSLGMKRPLLVTDPGLAGLPMVARAVELCRAAGLGCEVYSNVQPNPVEENVTGGVAVFREGGHDGVIAFGGGSALDGAKAIALMVGQSRPLWDFEDREDWFTRVDVAAWRRWSRCQPPPAPAPRSVAPPSSPTFATTPRRSSSTRGCCPRS